jgi:hypothetical protein
VTLLVCVASEVDRRREVFSLLKSLMSFHDNEICWQIDEDLGDGGKRTVNGLQSDINCSFRYP